MTADLFANYRKPTPAQLSEMAEQRRAERLTSVYCALYAYAVDYGGGQDSMSYRLLCSVTRPGMLLPGPMGISYDDLGPEGRDLYDRLVKRGY